MEKIDFKKEYKELYNPNSKKVSFNEVPNLKYI